MTYLALAKADRRATPKTSTPLDPHRRGRGRRLRARPWPPCTRAGAPWVQLDEPALTSDNLPARPAASWSRPACPRVCEQLAAVATDRPQTARHDALRGRLGQAVGALAQTGVEAIHAPADQLARLRRPRRGGRGRPVRRDPGGRSRRRTLRLDRADLAAAAASLLGAAPGPGGGREWASPPPTSLLHVPLRRLRWRPGTTPTLDRQPTRQWLAFADQKVREVVTLASRPGPEGWELHPAREVPSARRAVLDQRARRRAGVGAPRGPRAAPPPVDRRLERAGPSPTPCGRNGPARQRLAPAPACPRRRSAPSRRLRPIRKARARPSPAASYRRGRATRSASAPRSGRSSRLQEDLGVDVLVATARPSVTTWSSTSPSCSTASRPPRNGWVAVLRLALHPSLRSCGATCRARPP